MPYSPCVHNTKSCTQPTYKRCVFFVQEIFLFLAHASTTGWHTWPYLAHIDTFWDVRKSHSCIQSIYCLHSCASKYQQIRIPRFSQGWFRNIVLLSIHVLCCSRDWGLQLVSTCSTEQTQWQNRDTIVIVTALIFIVLYSTLNGQPISITLDLTLILITYLFWS